MNSYVKPLMVNCPSSGVNVTSYIVYMLGHNLGYAQVYNDHILTRLFQKAMTYFFLNFIGKWARCPSRTYFHFIFENGLILSFIA